MSGIKFFGKDQDGNAKAVKVNNDGIVQVARVWENGVNTIFEQEIRDTNGRYTNLIDVSEYAFVSLRIKNTLVANTDKVKVSFVFLPDVDTSGNTWLQDENGTIECTVGGGGYDITMITPDDYPVLNYLTKLRLRVEAKEIPTDGSLIIQAVCKR